VTPKKHIRNPEFYINETILLHGWDGWQVSTRLKHFQLPDEPVSFERLKGKIFALSKRESKRVFCLSVVSSAVFFPQQGTTK
jgi:hypothetical protein